MTRINLLTSILLLLFNFMQQYFNSRKEPLCLKYLSPKICQEIAFKFNRSNGAYWTSRVSFPTKLEGHLRNVAKERRTGEHQDQSRRELETTKFNADKKRQCYSLKVITYIYIWCFSKCSYWVYVIIENYKTNLKRKHHKIKLLAESLKKSLDTRFIPYFWLENS